jgi:hypothetical protein
MTAEKFEIRRRAASVRVSSDLYAHLEFFPPLDSDELFDALREFYPIIRSHKDRLCKAVIDFYERILTQSKIEPAWDNRRLPLPPMAPSNLGPPGPSSSASSPCNTRDCIALLQVSTPSAPANSSVPATPAGKQAMLPRITRDGALPGSSDHRSKMVSMISAFSANGAIELKRGAKRPLSELERKDYRHMRHVGACEKCRKRKRKVCFAIGQASPMY